MRRFGALHAAARTTILPIAMTFCDAYVDEGTAGPTEKFVHNYGKRVHHLAFRTENIEI